MKQYETALITGASGGIGYEFAKVFAERGVNLVIVARSEDKLNMLADELKNKHQIDVKVIAKDLSSAQSVQEISEEIEEAGIQIDYLINNAGFAQFGKFADNDWQRESDMINLNISTLTHFTKLYLKKMISVGKGRILNVASTAAYQPMPMMAVYGATKSYVLSFTEAVAAEANGSGVTVTALCPGATKSGFGEDSGAGKSIMFNNFSTASSRSVAEYGYESMMSGKHSAIHGILNKIAAVKVRFLPHRWVTKLMMKVLDK
ncbi:MAG: SDR family oxidoreductase [Candidatus Kapabacteria bacterium]|jgi:short-subunit dehydrogenase|nr:SDR family oxidoreductase [Candidatus Kapabacteria bacterium]